MCVSCHCLPQWPYQPENHSATQMAHVQVSTREHPVPWHILQVGAIKSPCGVLTSAQSLSPVRLFATPWTVAHQASLSVTNSNSQTSLKPMSIESVTPSNNLILCRPFSCCQSFPASGSFSMSWFATSGGQCIGVSASASAPMNSRDWFSLGLTGLISLLSKGLSRVFSNMVQKHQFFSAQLFFRVQLSHP